MENIPRWIRTLIEPLLSLASEKPIMKLTVKEYLWGYQDPILAYLKSRLFPIVSNDQVSVFASVVTFNR